MARSIGQGTQFRPDTQAGVLAGNLPERVSKGGNPNAKNMGDVLAEAGQRMAQVEARRIEGVKRDSRAQGKLELGVISDQTMFQVQKELPGQSHKWASRYDELFKQNSAEVIGKHVDTLTDDKQWELIQESINARTHSAIRKSVFAARGQEALADWSQFVKDSGSAVTIALDEAGDPNYASIEDIVQSFNEHADELIEEGIVSQTQIERDRAAFMANVDKSHVSRLLTNIDDANLLQSFADNYEYKSDAIGHQEGLKAKIATRVGQLEIKNAERVSVLTGEAKAKVDDIVNNLDMGVPVSDEAFESAEKNLKEILQHPKADKRGIGRRLLYLSALKENKEEFQSISKIMRDSASIGPEKVEQAEAILAGVRAWATSASSESGDATARNKVLTVFERSVNAIKTVANQNVTAEQRAYNIQFKNDAHIIESAVKNIAQTLGTKGATKYEIENISSAKQQLIQAYQALGQVTDDQIKKGIGSSVTQIETKQRIGHEINALDALTRSAAAIESLDSREEWDKKLLDEKERARKFGYDAQFAKYESTIKSFADKRSKDLLSNKILSSIKSRELILGHNKKDIVAATKHVLDRTYDQNGNPYLSSEGEVIPYRQYLFENASRQVDGLMTGAGVLQAIGAATGFADERTKSMLIDMIRVNPDEDTDPAAFKSNMAVVTNITDHTGAAWDNLPSELRLARKFHEFNQTLAADKYIKRWNDFNTPGDRNLMTEERVNERLNGIVSNVVDIVASTAGKSEESVRNKPVIMNSIIAESGSMRQNINKWFFASGEDTDTIVAQNVWESVNKLVNVDPLSVSGSANATLKHGDSISLSQMATMYDFTGGKIVDWISEAVGEGDRVWKKRSPSAYHYVGLDRENARDMMASDLAKFARDKIPAMVKERFKDARLSDARITKITNNWIKEFEDQLMNTETAPSLYKSIGDGVASNGYPLYAVQFQVDNEVVYFQDTFQFGFHEEKIKTDAEYEAERAERAAEARAQFKEGELPENPSGLSGAFN